MDFNHGYVMTNGKKTKMKQTNRVSLPVKPIRKKKKSHDKERINSENFFRKSIFSYLFIF